MKQQLFVLFILLSGVVVGQKFKFIDESFTHTAELGKDDIDATIRVKIEYSIFMGEPMVSAVAKAEYGDRCSRNGQYYYKSDMGEDIWKSIKFSSLNFEVDVYQDGNYVTTQTFPNLFSYDISGSPNWGGVWPKTTAEQEKELFKNGFQLKNPRLVNLETTGFHKLDYKLKKEADGKEHERLVALADQQLANNEFEEARGNYYKARALKKSEYVEQKLHELAVKKEQFMKKKDAEESVKKGDEALANGDPVTAEMHYKAALQKDPDNPNIENKISEAQNAVSEKEQEAKEKAAQDSVDSANEKSEAVKLSSNKEKEEGSESVSTGKSAEMLEFERKQRMIDHIKKQNEITQNNLDFSGKMGASALLLHYALGKYIYRNLKKDSDKNFWMGDSYKMGFKLGYGVHSAPIFDNSSYLIYDGNNYTYDERTLNYQTFTLDFSGEANVWPIYSKHFAAGAYVKGVGGHGILFQNYRYAGEMGLMAFAGGEIMKLRAEYTKGFRHYTYSPWIVADEFGSGGKSDYSFQRLAFGPTFTFDVEIGQKKKSMVSVMGVFERPDLEANLSSNSPLVFGWTQGLRLGWDISNRLNINFEYLWSYRRTGDVEYGIDDEVTYGGDLVTFELTRNFDYYGTPAESRKFEEVKNVQNKRGGWMLYLASPTLSWFTPVDDTTFTSDLMFGMAPIAIAKEIPVMKWASIDIGIGANILNGGKVRFTKDVTIGEVDVKSQNTIRISGYGLELPIGIKLMNSFNSSNNYWLKGGVKGQFNYYTSELATDPTDLNFDPLNELQLESLSFHYLMGAGMDYVLNEKKKVSAGIIYSTMPNSLSGSLFSGLKGNSLSLQIGFNL